MARHSGFHVVETESAEAFGDDTRRALFTIGELGVHVKVAAHLDELWTQCFG